MDSFSNHWGATQPGGVEEPHALEGKYPTVVTHLPQAGADIGTVQELLGHSDVSTTVICTEALKVTAGGTVSLLDALATQV